MSNEALIEIGTFIFDTTRIFTTFSLLGPLRFLLGRLIQPLDFTFEQAVLMLFGLGLLFLSGLPGLIIALLDGNIRPVD